jgi:hypothetical protein
MEEAMARNRHAGVTVKTTVICGNANCIFHAAENGSVCGISVVPGLQTNHQKRKSQNH